MFKLFGKKTPTEVFVAPVTGQLIPIEKVDDEVFSQKIMGEGFAVVPTENQIYSPVAGTVKSIFPTKHALGITTKNGLEVLVHMGLDTVELEGKAFSELVEEGDQVEAGQPLMQMDLDTVKQMGKPTTIVIVITDSDKLQDIPTITEKEITHGDQVGQFSLHK
ncbi:PTS sugar transporter subunit IIA [Loigolactobacillus jiayinensis]|uniref:PTS glucose transporter subunit IIA n=1 Tax=Loigolactobacillus jiayinensis TaxID=2486016 RepID=A0ABW1RBJ4_9LACO|nr:PTS glucose transporter subunit IIA [Loigolactobacillus jiayinensis]